VWLTSWEYTGNVKLFFVIPILDLKEAYTNFLYVTRAMLLPKL